MMIMTGLVRNCAVCSSIAIIVPLSGIAARFRKARERLAII